MRAFRLVLVSALVLAACSPFQSGNAPSSTEDTGGNGETGTTRSAPSSQAGASRTIQVTAENWMFTPSEIRVKKGEKVTLELVGESGIHGMSIPGLQVSQRVELGQTASVALPTDTAGTFNFFCNIPCGSGHKEMKGTIVIED